MKAWKLSPLAVALISINSYAVEPVGIALGNGLTLLPAVKLDVENNSNIYSTESNEQSDTITRLTPSLNLLADFGKTQAGAYYQAEQGIYSADGTDDYLDQKLNVGVSHEITSRQEISAEASYNDAHDARGAGTVEGAGAAIVDPDEYEEVTAGVKYVYGADSAIGNVTAYVDSYQKRYSNNEIYGTEDRNHDKLNFGAILSLTSSSSNEVILEARQTNISYSEDSAVADAREGSEQRLFVGMRWDISGATTGEFKVGRSSRFFDESSVSSNVRLAWEGNLTWQPLTYSTVVISSSQNSNETNGAGDYIANTYTSASWDHEFSTYYSAGLTASVSSDVYVADADDRKDDLVSYGINGTYSPMPTLDITLSYSQAQRDSNINAFEYDNQVVNLGLNFAL
jgi:hypothetical protein